VSLIKQPQCKKQATLTNEKLLQPVLDALPDGVYITDGNGVTVTINKAYERITGLQRHRVFGKHMQDLVWEGYISNSVSLEVIRERQPFTGVQTIKGNRKIVVSGNPVFDENGMLEYVKSSVRDLTALLRAKHAEEQLEQQVEGLERKLISNALSLYGSTRAAAASLGINQSTLVKKRQNFQSTSKDIT
jgi:PAS domain S-box-containing protein